MKKALVTIIVFLSTLKTHAEPVRYVLDRPPVEDIETLMVVFNGWNQFSEIQFKKKGEFYRVSVACGEPFVGHEHVYYGANTCYGTEYDDRWTISLQITNEGMKLTFIADQKDDFKISGTSLEDRSHFKQCEGNDYGDKCGAEFKIDGAVIDGGAKKELSVTLPAST